MRGGKELPSSSALDSPSVLSKLATPKPDSAINFDMSHVKEICPRGNNKVIIFSLYHDKCLLFMLELY